MKGFLIRVAISLGFIALLFYLVRNDIPQIAETIRSVDRMLLAAALGVGILAVLVMAVRLRLIFAAEELPIPMLDTANLSFIGFFFNNFLPTSVGGDLVKILCASRITAQPVKSVTTILMDRIFGLFTFVLIPSFSLLFFLKQMQNPAVPALIYTFLVVSLFFFILLFNRSVARRFRFIEHLLRKVHLAEKARLIYDGLHQFQRHKGVVAAALGLSIVGQSVNILAIVVFSRALGLDLPVIYFFLLIPVVHLLSMLPSLNGLGIREGAYTYFLTPFIGRENAIAIGILWLGNLFLLSLIGAVIYLIRHDYHFRFREAQRAAETI